MEQKLACEIVKDLLPLYVDKMVSDVSRESIEEHLEHCENCREVYHNMTRHLETETQPEEVGDVKRFLKKTKIMYLLYGLVGLSFVAIIVCMIVDLAVSKGLSWSLIVTCACLFADVLLYVLLGNMERKGCVIMAVISVGTFLLLTVIQVVLYYLMGTGTVWVMRYGFPILLLWLLVLWIPVLGGTFLKWNIWNCIALLMLLSLVGNYATKLITGDYVWDDVLHLRGFLGNGLGFVAGTVLFGLLGIVKRWRKKGC